MGVSNDHHEVHEGLEVYFYFIIFMYFMVKNIQNRSGCENVITASYNLLCRGSKKMREAPVTCCILYF